MQPFEDKVGSSKPERHQQSQTSYSHFRDSASDKSSLRRVREAFGMFFVFCFFFSFEVDIGTLAP